MNADEDKSALLEAMRRQAEDEKAAILARGEEQIAEIRAQAEARVEAIRAEAAREVARQIRLLSEQMLGEVEAQERLALLELKRRLLADAFQAARAKLLGMASGDDPVPGLAGRIEEAVASVGDNVRVSVAERDRPLCQEVLQRSGATGCVEAAEAPGTLVVTSQQGRRRVDNSLSTRLDRAELLLQDQVARILFGAAGPGGESP